MMQTPLSIITVNYNNKEGLLNTIESINRQSLKSFEFIIIDGGSEDGSLEVLKTFSDAIDHWVSEKDSGVYHAMNKGIEKANGKYLLFLNSGDYLASDITIEEVLPLVHSEDIIYGNLIIKEGKKNWLKEYPSKLKFTYFFNESLPHSGGSFFSRNCFKGELQHYDEELKIVSDWKWYIMAIFKFNYSYRHINKSISVFENSGLSFSEPELIKKEKEFVLEKEFSAIYPEVSELLQVQSKYNTLLSSKALKFYLNSKKFLKL